MSKNCLHCGKPMQSLRITKKYCCVNCKQLAFYKRNGLQLSGLNTDSPLLTIQGAENAVITINTENKSNEPSSGKTSSLPSNDRESFTLNDTTTIKTAQEEIAYQWVHSRLVDLIEENADNPDELLLFQNPAEYWGSFTLEGVKWVSLRLRCLLESLIRLSNYTHIRYADLTAICDAFDSLVTSRHFRYLPNNYPYIDLVKELKDKLTLLARPDKHTKKFLFRLTLNRKATLIAKRFILAGFVPAIKFGDLDFKE